MSRTTSRLGLAAAATAVVSLATAGSAFADLAPTPGDAVGIGSDTVQNIGNFLADGDNKGDVGYNSTGPKNRLVSFDATPDANDRSGFLNGSTLAAQKPLNPTIVLRQGLQPVQRPNGSGAGVAALINDGVAHNIDFVRMSRLPKTSEQDLATKTAGVGSLRVVKISTDALQLATSSTTNAPPTLTAAQIVSIYQCSSTDWATVGGSAGTIAPQIPQAGSGTGDTFRADLAKLNGGTAVTLGGCVTVVEENDPASVNTNPNAVVPFSAGRKALYDSGYFNDPAAKYGTPQTALSSGLRLVGGDYKDTRGLYIVFRNSDVDSTKLFQPGGTLNIVQDLFYNPAGVGGATPFVQSDPGRAAITAAGATPTFVDCGEGTTVTSC